MRREPGSFYRMVVGMLEHAQPEWGYRHVHKEARRIVSEINAATGGNAYIPLEHRYEDDSQQPEEHPQGEQPDTA